MSHSKSQVRRAEEYVAISPSARYGVWCVEDSAWCSQTVGTHVHASLALPKWQSGEASGLSPEDAASFHYELRRSYGAEIDELRGALVPLSDHANALDERYVWDDDEPAAHVRVGLTVGDCRRARRLIEGVR